MDLTHCSSVNSKGEIESYLPWICMTNVGLALLKKLELDGVKKPSSDDIISIRNDPSILKYVQNDTTVNRKPGTVLVSKSVAEKLYVSGQAQSVTWEEIAAGKFLNFLYSSHLMIPQLSR